MEYKLALRQLSIKSVKSNSWFMKIHSILDKYNLPSAYGILLNPPTKQEWKKLVMKSFTQYWEKQWQNEHSTKTSLKYLNIKSCKMGAAHPIWESVSNNAREVRRATIKAKLVTGTYVLQSNRAVFNQYEVDGTCQLCSNGVENRTHFLVMCRALNSAREPHLHIIKSFIHEQLGTTSIPALTETEWWSHLILDCSHTCVQELVHMEKDQVLQMERLTRNLCYALHATRSKLVFPET